jgi:MFS family permease
MSSGAGEVRGPAQKRHHPERRRIALLYNAFVLSRQRQGGFSTLPCYMGHMISSSRILPLVVAAALFMENMDSTVIATSLPAIAADLGTNPVSLKLAFTTYLLSLTVFLPISGWLADKYGAKLVFRAAIGVFTLASIACGFAPSLGWLVALRGLQGLGGAMMVPVGRIILIRTVPKSCKCDGVADGSCPYWPVAGATNWWLHHHIFSLAVDFLDEFAVWHFGRGIGQHVFAQYA